MSWTSWVLLLAPKDPFELVRVGVSAAEAVNVASRDEAGLLLRLLWSGEDEEEEDDAPPFTCPVPRGDEPPVEDSPYDSYRAGVWLHSSAQTNVCRRRAAVRGRVHTQL